MLKIKFLHNGNEYSIYCKSYSYSPDMGMTCFFLEHDLLYTLESIVITWVYISELNPVKFMGNTDFPYFK